MIASVKKYWVLLLSIVAFIGLTLFEIREAAVWHDEGYSYMLAQYDLGELLRRTALDVHPPLYYILLKGWMGVFGTSVIALRSLSIVAGAGVLAGSFLLLRHLFSHQVAQKVIPFLAVAPFIVRYAQEARMYMLATLLLLVATYALVKLEAAASKWWIIVYAVFGSLALYSHYYSGFILLAHAVYVGMSHTNFSITNVAAHPIAALKNIPRRWWYSWSAMVALFLPWIPTAYAQFTEIQGGFWIGDVSHSTFFSTFTKFVLYQDHWMLKAWWSVLAVALVVLMVIGLRGAWKQADNKTPLRLLMYLSFIPPVTIFILSLPPMTPVYNDRYFALAAPYFFMLFGLSAWYWFQRRPRYNAVWGAIMVIGLVLGLNNMYNNRNFNSDNLSTHSYHQMWDSIEPTLDEEDKLIATNMYLFFDAHYYARHTKTVHYYAPQELPTMGNYSLIYDRDDLLIEDWNELGDSGHVWVSYIDENDLENIPAEWDEVETLTYPTMSARRYSID